MNESNKITVHINTNTGTESNRKTNNETWASQSGRRTISAKSDCDQDEEHELQSIEIFR